VVDWCEGILGREEEKKSIYQSTPKQLTTVKYR